MIKHIYEMVREEYNRTRGYFTPQSRVTAGIWLTFAVGVVIHIVSLFIFCEVDDVGGGVIHVHSTEEFGIFATVLNVLP